MLSSKLPEISPLRNSRSQRRTVGSACHQLRSEGTGVFIHPFLHAIKQRAVTMKDELCVTSGLFLKAIRYKCQHSEARPANNEMIKIRVYKVRYQQHLLQENTEYQGDYLKIFRAQGLAPIKKDKNKKCLVKHLVEEKGEHTSDCVMLAKFPIVLGVQGAHL